MPGLSSENLGIYSENNIFDCFRLENAQNAFAHVAKHVLRRKDGVAAQIADICRKSTGLEHICRKSTDICNLARWASQLHQLSGIHNIKAASRATRFGAINILSLPGARNPSIRSRRGQAHNEFTAESCLETYYRQHTKYPPRGEARGSSWASYWIAPIAPIVRNP